MLSPLDSPSQLILDYPRMPTPPISIFFDLETSDLLKVGQILNFCFLAVGPDWKVIDKLIGTVRISPLQLPRISAILANRTNVLEHQKTAKFSEREALKAIDQFIRKYANQPTKLPLIGYNSERFDIGYLRTSFLRNGIHPYLPVATKDLINVSRSLLLTNEAFRSLLLRYEKPNFKLETMCRLHSLLEGEQLHESEADVMLTVALAEAYLKLYDVDVRSYEPYQLNTYHGKAEPVKVLRAAAKDLTEEKFTTQKVMVYLKGTERAALWVDLEKFRKASSREKKIESVSRYKIGEPLICEECTEDLSALREAAISAKSELAEITEDDIYPENKAYIEEWIYRLNPNAMTRFIRILEGREAAQEICEDTKILLSRYRLDSVDHLEDSTDAMKDSFRRYVQYRYGGKMVIEQTRTAKETKNVYHPTYAELLAEIEEKEKTCSNEGDINLIAALKGFYEKSEISGCWRGKTSENP